MKLPGIIDRITSGFAADPYVCYMSGTDVVRFFKYASKTLCFQHTDIFSIKRLETLLHVFQSLFRSVFLKKMLHPQYFTHVEFRSVLNLEFLPSY